MSKNDGGPAFPGTTVHGMTLHQWYKGQALAGVMALMLQADMKNLSMEDIVNSCDNIADAMIAERGKE